MVFCKRYLFLSMFNLVVWIFCPLVYNFTMSKHVLTHFQRLSVTNFYLPLSKKSYNKYFFLSYVVKTMFVTTIALFMLSFDIFYFTICTAIAAQYENYTDGTQMYEELKIIISDYQNVHLYMKEFCSIVRPVVLVEVVLCFFSIVTCSYIVALQIVTHSFSVVDFLPALTTMVTYCILLYIYLYFTDLMNEKRDGVNFGLYSCDWTAMDKRFKKLIILAMAMNNANQLKIKATPNRVINLELFLVVLRTSYTILSFMVNAKLSSSDNVN
ncbi:odorant receptor 67a-like [Adelges cooleyi]|uniref:odorant receptor 67a-like n=1 Tax=Adelges cooleyi TaxID=133065 RepID=UPI00217FE801|nr:odorant receptor 67a-like [Adelges cooleyi]